MKNKFFSIPGFSFLKNSSIILLFILAMCNSIKAQSFLKTYNDQQNPSYSVSFECITPTTDASGNFYIGGHGGQFGSIALYYVNQAGNVLATTLIPNTASGSRLDGIIFDTNNDIVVIGNYETPTTIQGFVFKFLTGSSTVAWFSETNVSDLISFDDIALIPSSSNYRISGANGLSTFLHVNIMDVNGTTGVIAPTPFTNYKVNNVEEGTALQIANNNVYITGRYAVGTGAYPFRPALSRFNLSGVHQNSKYYLVNRSKNARLYPTDMLMSQNDGVITGHGDFHGQNVFESLTLTKVKSANGKLIWAKKYDDITEPLAGSFSAIRYDNGITNYVVMGYRIKKHSTELEEAFLTYMDSSGNVLWSNKYTFYRRPTRYGYNSQYVLLVNSGFIYAVGQTTNSSNFSEGMLLKVSTANGMLSDANGGNCFDPLTFTVTPYTISIKTTPSFLTPSFTSTSLTANQESISLAEQQICGSCCRLEQQALNTESETFAFPNPFSGNFRLSLPENADATVLAFSAEGKLLESFSHQRGAIILGDNWPVGSYIVKVIYPGESVKAIKIEKSGK